MKTNTPIFAPILVGAMLIATSPAFTQDKAPTRTFTSPYSGEERRQVKALSAQDIDDLVNGRGWGFAKSAELNGLPGPVHLLEMADAMGLSGAQVVAIKSLHAAMKEKAIPLGKSLVALERELDDLFKSGSVTEDQLRAHLARIGKVRSELRFVHLAAHLKTPAIVSRHQTAAYNKLRGYSSGGGSHAGHGN